MPFWIVLVEKWVLKTLYFLLVAYVPESGDNQKYAYILLLVLIQMEDITVRHHTHYGAVTEIHLKVVVIQIVF